MTDVKYLVYSEQVDLKTDNCGITAEWLNV
jgi:hypothetical protein